MIYGRKILPILFASLIFIIAIISLFIFRHQEATPTQLEFCESLPDETKATCNDVYRKCPNVTETGFWSCLALGLVRIDINAARRACEQITIIESQKFCLADAMSEINFTYAQEECNSIDKVDRKAFCLSTILKRRDPDLAVKECDAIIDQDVANNCRALAMAAKDKERAKEYCEKIEDIIIKENCLRSI
jgi:hypothetical protein